ncbi:motility associated factor glycosyltransferase family protein [Shewanella insulae]|uniref:motility associated factor glycosyltransferase family protein n=1 Tax=Shewanella insulae TaxID=2681496 RepID=UPI002480CD31|nr:6-hydroxymethylpterin diphosphokinase MptE-like protein [Shewanella insulae]
MTELFNANLNIISQRWPIIASALQQVSFDHLDAALVTGQNQTISVNGIQLSSRHDRLAEARLLINTIPKETQEVNVYGIGMGDVPSLLIDNPQYTQINVFILNFAVIALVLSYTDQSEWLSHPSVILSLNPDATLDYPYVAIPPELSLCDEVHARLRDLLVMELNQDFANRRHRLDDPLTLERFKCNEALIIKDPDAASLIETIGTDEAIVIGSGPSLEEHYDYLRALCKQPNKPMMIAADTALRGLFHNDIRPDIVVTVDSLIDSYHLPLEDTDDIKLVYFPKANPRVLENWRGPRFIAYGQSDVYDALAQQYPKLRLYISGSVIHPAIDLAVNLKAKQITLFGCDFGYCHDKSHAFWSTHSFSQEDSDARAWVSAVDNTRKTARHWVLDGHGNRITTDLNLRAYLRYLELYIARHPQVGFYRASLSGADIQGTQHKEPSA